MKKLFILLSGLCIISCGRGEKCDCTQQKYQRKAVYTLAPPQQLLSSTKWQKIKGEEPVNISDCNQNKTLRWLRNGNSTNIPGTRNWSRMEFELRIACQ